MNRKLVFLGVGGQGIILLTRALGEALARKGEKVISTETHGMATRGGSVVSFMKVGNFESPLIKCGEADVVVALHPDEVEKGKVFLKNGGIFIGPDKLEQIASEHGLKRRLYNMIALGFLAKLFNLKLDSVFDVLSETGKQSEENKNAVKIGYSWEESNVSAPA